ncbi:uroporphyrinogen-III decarboxylase [Dorea sp. CAG:317]|nr:uroporphyrinogen-III decarboxylase [Dorea sp. CAG:317]
MNNLSSEERMSRFYNGEKIDRVPMLSCATMYAGLQKGLSSKEFYFDVEKAFQAQKDICDECGYDDSPCYDLPHGEILDLGGDLFIPKEGKVALPFVKKFQIESLEEAWKYELPPVNERIFTKLRIEFLKYAETKGQMGVSISAGSPFTMVGSMVETGLLMRWLAKEPDVVRHLLKIAVQYLSETADLLIQEFGIERCSVSSNYPFESNNLISPKIFKKYAYPAMMEIHEELRKKGLSSFGIHLCGNHNKNLEFFKDLNLSQRSFISSDEDNSLKKIAGVLGKEHIYAGNVSTKFLVEGTQEQVYQQSREIIEQMKYNEGGFILMPSCDLPINTKPENLGAMLQAACDFGRY